MRKLFIENIKKMLEEEYDIITKRMQNSCTDIDTDGDETDEIQAKILFHASSRLLARDKEKIYQIKNAFKKIVEGTFGICEECEEEIAEKRLLANPSYATCISCAEQMEIEIIKNRKNL